MRTPFSTKPATPTTAPKRTTRAMGAMSVSMAVAIALVAALAYWDERRESAAALHDFAEEQATLASALAVGLGAQLDFSASDRAPGANPRALDAQSAATLLASVRSVARPGSLQLFARAPTIAGLVTTDGRVVRCETIEDAFAKSQSWVRLSREEAAGLGLPERTAIAGLGAIASPRDGDAGAWGVAVVATAQRERDRERRAQARLVLGVVLAAGLVLAFGGLALRKQRQELELARELAIAEVRRDRDDRLVRADKLATMGALATGIAHEVSTPLGVIVGRVEQLARQRPLAGDESTKRALDAISEQAERIGRIIRGFLGLARGDSPAMERVDPGALARASVALVEHRFAQAGVSLEQSAASELPAITCEPRLFEQVLVNLLLNACDACERGGHVTLAVSARAKDDDGGERVVFQVTDDGAGITPQAAARAMEPFFTTKPAGKGTGLGLAIASEIVKHHRGTLTLSARATSAGARETRGTCAIVEVFAAKENDETRS